MIGRRFVLGLALVLAAAGQGCAAEASVVTVKIENFTFNPAELTVKPGTTITFENADDIPHSVIDKAGAFHSKPLDTGDSFKMTVTDAGEITYFCGFHPHMVGRIIVKQ